jgi:predicted cupin superfamily sugar epimerase
MWITTERNTSDFIYYYFTFDKTSLYHQKIIFFHSKSFSSICLLFEIDVSLKTLKTLKTMK